MHGVSKTALSDEQKEAKRLERQKKQERFLKVRDVILKKSTEGHYDDEGMKLTAVVLAKNPDLYVFWNYRKRTITRLLEHQATPASAVQPSSEEQPPSTPAAVDLESCYRNELSLTEECLRDNPKSYAAWYHRQWILQRYFQHVGRTTDLLKSELRHCAEGLKYDERNFHCWDHRRFVCQLASVPESEELQFSKEKIDDNFSNYSAWHYRSALLPHLYPPAENDSVLRLEEGKLKEELVYVQNAFFTDPEDQSAWFYHCWLFRPIENAVEKLKLRYLYVSSTSPSVAIIAFNQSVNLNSPQSPVKILIDDAPFLSSGWSTPDSSRSCPIWIRPLTPEEGTNSLTKKTLSIYVNGDVALEIDLASWNEEERLRLEFVIPKNPAARILPALQPALPPSFRAALEESMTSCRELKSLVEPTSNKWPSLTEILSMRSLDLLKYESEIQSGLESLMEVDPRKRPYYADLKSKYLIEARLLKYAMNQSAYEHVKLSDLRLTALPALGTTMLLIGVSTLDLKNNQLVSAAPLGYLLSLQRLFLDGNCLENTNGLGSLIHLELLSLSSNRLGPTCADSLSDLKRCASLKELVLSGNPIGEHESAETILVFLERPKDSLSVIT